MDDSRIPTTNRSPERSFGGCLVLKVGVVATSSNALGLYTVATDAGNVQADLLSDSGSPISGTRGGGQIAPGTWVIIAASFDGGGSGDSLGHIVGVVRGSYSSNADSFADHDVLVPNAGYVWDTIHNLLPTTSPEREDLINLNDGAPLDALSGDWGKYNPLGPAIHVGTFMSYLRAGDRCGVWAFTMEELLRIAARSVQEFTLGGSTEDLVDEGAEINLVRQRALLPWEAVGSIRPESPVAEETGEDQADPRNPPKRPPLDLQHSDVVGIFRETQLNGYLADIDRRFIHVPDLEDDGPRRSSTAEEDSEKVFGVFEQTTASDGSFTLRSAKSVTIEKYTAVPVPLRRHEQWDPRGDTPENTKFSGNFGDGEVQNRYDYRFGGSDSSSDRAVLGLELHGFAALQQNRAIRSRQDWATPLESDTRLGKELGSGTYPDYKLDPNRSWMALPKYIDIDVQKGRWEKVRYYASRSAIDMMDDGSVVVDDGYGAQIIMGGGNVMITAPNDIILAPGRSIIHMAPQDLILKAGNSVDLTASNGDVRVKAEKNLQMLGGNGGRGGVLLEDRSEVSDWSVEPGEASEYGGIAIKSASSVCLLGSDLFLHSTRGDAVVRSRRNFSVLSDDVVFNTGVSFTVSIGDRSQEFGTTDASRLSVLTFDYNSFVLGASSAIPKVVVNTVEYAPGSESVTGFVLNGAFVWSGTGVWDVSSLTARLTMQFTGGISSRNSDIGDLSPNQDEKIKGEIAITKGALSSLFSELGQATQDSWNTFAEPFEYTDGPTFLDQGAVLSSVSFSLRTSRDYGLLTDDSFRIPQWRWQQYALQAGGSDGLSTWEEKEVIFGPSDIPTSPWPGRELWSEKPVYAKLGDPTFFKNGFTAADSGGSVDESPIDNTVLADSYIVNTFNP